MQIEEPKLTVKDYLDSVLTEQEQTYVRNFADNEKMFEAVKIALLAGTQIQGVIEKGIKFDPTINAALAPLFSGQKITNEEMGAYARAFKEGIMWITSGFDGLYEYRTKEKRVDKNENPAR